MTPATAQRGGAMLGLCLALLCGAAPAASAQRYTVNVDAGLSRLDVVTCFEAPPPARLSAADAAAGDFLQALGVRAARDTGAATHAGRHIRLHDLSAGDCLEYRVTLDGMETRNPRRGVPRTGSTRLIDPRLWLWLPDTAAGPVEVRFKLPGGIGVSAPWETLDTGPGHALYRIGLRPRDWPARVALGRMERFDIAVPGATLRVAVLDAEPVAQRATIHRWLEDCALALGKVYGRFPVPELQVLVVPRGPAREPVPWAQVMRGGGDAVHLYIDQTRPLQAFLDDWTLLHELSHLLHPPIVHSDTWVYEGLASYYQNLLRARGGFLAPAAAWQRLHAGFRRGIDGTPPQQTLAQVARDMRHNRRFMRVYWSGAAIALLADVELRRASGGTWSLDSALDAFQSCCLPAQRQWSGAAFLDRLDAITGTRVFHDLRASYADSTSFPDLTEAYRLLGLDADGAALRLLDDAPLGAVRRAIMHAGDIPESVAAQRPERCRATRC